MRRRILILGSCLLLASCSAGGTNTVVGATGKSPPPTATSHAGPPGPPTVPPGDQSWHRDIGITDGGQVAGHDHACQNSYGGPYKGGWVSICAGGKQNSSNGNSVFVQGGVWVGWSPDPRASGPIDNPPATGGTLNEYDAPNSPTWVKITKVDGPFVHLQREDGSTLTFNLDTNQYT